MCIRDRPTKVETNGSDGAKNILTRAEIAACDGIIVAAEKKVETARFDEMCIRDRGWPVLELQKLAQPGAACNSTGKGLQLSLIHI